MKSRDKSDRRHRHAAKLERRRIRVRMGEKGQKTRRQGNKSDVRVWAAGRTREGLPRI